MAVTTQEFVHKMYVCDLYVWRMAVSEVGDLPSKFCMAGTWGNDGGKQVWRSKGGGDKTRFFCMPIMFYTYFTAQHVLRFKIIGKGMLMKQKSCSVMQKKTCRC